MNSALFATRHNSHYAELGIMGIFINEPRFTVSETVSESGKRVVKNSGGLKRILLETPIESALFGALDRSS
ncbi:MAG: hypothetical protein ACLQAH_16930 [Limisphaerales bacterium]